MKLLNEILGTKYPIIQGGMANIATGEFAAACSNAGALGIIGAGGMNADTLRQMYEEDIPTPVCAVVSSFSAAAAQEILATGVRGLALNGPLAGLDLGA